MYNENKGEGEQRGEQGVVNTPAIGITLQQQFDEFRSVVFQSFVAADCTKTELNGMLDKLRIASERQKAITQLPTKQGILNDFRARLTAEIEKYQQMQVGKDQLHARWEQESIVGGRRGPGKLSAAQIQEGTRADQALNTCRVNIDQLRAEIAVHERLVANMEAAIAAGD